MLVNLRLNFILKISFLLTSFFIAYSFSTREVSAACTCTGTVTLYDLKCSSSGVYCPAGSEGQGCDCLPIIGCQGTCQRADFRSSRCSTCGVSPGSCFPFCEPGVGFIGYTGSCWVCTGPAPSPTPGPSGGCDSTWCTTTTECASVGGTWSSGAGFCSSSSAVRCCPPSSGGGFVPNCAWDTGAVGYPRCNYGEGNACPDRFCNPPFGICRNCAPGLVNMGGICLCPPTCSISLNPNPAIVTGGGGTTTLTAGTSVAVDSVNFSSSNTGIATATTPDTTSPYTTTVTGLNKGLATITATGIMSGFAACSTTASLNVTDPGPWWQVKDGDVITNGKVVSSIPSTCATPGCTPNFDLDGAGGYPGVVAAGSSSPSVFSSPGGSGRVSSKGWFANSSYLGKTYNYSFFEGLIPSTVSINDIPTDTIDGNYFQTNGTPQNNFVWFRRNGNLTITGNVNVNATRKVILLVKGGDLTVNSQIRLKKTGDGFFMAAVNGSINFDSSLTGSGNQPAVEGLFLADNQIRTGVGNQQFYIRGALAGLGGVVLQRDLQANNANTPAELIEYAPDLIFAYPRDLTRTRVVWREVAP